ncbi:MAG: quinolinate synthetase complex, subunit [Rickettsiaceae bacterium]|jgi:quinolinate synthase|nr:quinolinate synthetase complex, subunit [Rickettsiaceae bacterium]
MKGKINNIINLEEEILNLKHKLEAKLVSHHFQDSEVIDIADFIGSTAEIINFLRETDSKNIILATSHNVAELINNLFPEKDFILPRKCDYYNSSFKTVLNIIESNKDNKNISILAHLNSPNKFKTFADSIFTISSIEQALEKCNDAEEILLIGSINLGKYFSKKFARKMTGILDYKDFHTNFSVANLIKAKANYPSATILAHPECSEQILEYATFIGSNRQLIDYVKGFTKEHFLVAAEPSIIYIMQSLSDNFYLDIPKINDENNLVSNFFDELHINLEVIYTALTDTTNHTMQKDIKCYYDIENKISKLIDVQ